MYAITHIAGKQYKVEPNQYLYIPFQKELTEGSTITFDQVLLLDNDKEPVQIGAPYIPNAQVTATILAHVKADKTIVFKKKRRKGYKIKKGHRQPYTKIRINSITL